MNAVARIDLNADLGESSGERDATALMRSITSASIAAGFHAGDPSVLRATIRLANAHGVAIGAHPSFPDRDNFGRLEMQVAPAEAEDFVLYQVAAVAGVASAEGVRLQHVKAHGALYNMAARDRSLAAAIVRAVAAFDRSLVIFGPPHSQLLAAAQELGLRTRAEAFADRAYLPDGQLAPRGQPGAIITDPTMVLARALRIVKDRSVLAVDGSTIPLDAQTICVHSDTPGAAVLAATLRAGLEANGITVSALGR